MMNAEVVTAVFDKTPAKREYALTDLGNAERFIDEHCEDLRFVHTGTGRVDGQWLVWDGTRWASGMVDAVERKARETLRAMRLEAVDAVQRGPLWNHAVKSESAGHVRAMIDLARSDERISLRPADLDVGALPFNCANGTVNLETGEMQPHNRADLITKLSPVAYDPEAHDSLLQRVLCDWTGGDVDLQRFLQRAAGYSLSGDTSEEVFFFIYGPTASGKSSFLEALRAAWGDYARQTSFATFLQRKSDGPRDDIARLAGARLVSSIEVDEGARFAGALLKTLVGGDTISERELYSKYFEHRPTYKLWFAANDCPRLRDDDGAIWRRVLRTPFDHPIPEGKRDPAIKRRLLDPADMGPVLLAWAVEGFKKWRVDGLGIPEVVKRETAAYRAECDPLRDFLADCCVLDAGAEVGVQTLYDAYLEYARASGIRRTLGKDAFGKRLTPRGIESVSRGAAGRVRVGIRLITGITG